MGCTRIGQLRRYLRRVTMLENRRPEQGMCSMYFLLAGVGIGATEPEVGCASPVWTWFR